MTGGKKSSNTAAWTVEPAEDGIAFLVFDLPGHKVNKLSEAVIEELDRVLDEVASDKSIRGLVVIGGKEGSGTFIAGADISEIRAVTDRQEATGQARRGQAVLGKLSSMQAVTAAAIHGNCLGGGAELALACDFRIASDFEKTRLGLPEVQLGVIPGFGGTQRLPRLIGLARAMPIILTGKPLDARKALKLGAVDEVVHPGSLRDSSRAFVARALAGKGKSYRPRSRARKRSLLMRLFESTGPGRSYMQSRALKGIQRKVGKHYPAPRRALDAMVRGRGMSLEEGLKLEAKLVGELAVSDVCKNLIDIFLTSEAARRGDPGGKKGRGSARAPDKGGLVGLLGAGVMGGGLAALVARKGYRARMKDISREAITAGYQRIDEIFRGRVERGKMKKSEVINLMARISGATDYAGFRSAGLVIEAVVEDMEIKKKVLLEVEAELAGHVVFASNTSALSIEELQNAAKRPGRIAGLHFFNPVERMPLVEVIRGPRTTDAATVAVETFARSLGKIPVRCKDGPGFLVNRVLGAYLNEAVRLVEEGYSPGVMDQAIRDFGMPMGPLELIDEVGHDVASKVARILHIGLGERARPPALLASLGDDPSALGKKTGRGFYLHGSTGRGGKLELNRKLFSRIGKKASGFKTPTAGLWVQRLIYPMINEAAFALEDNVVEAASDVDLAMVFGTGFAPFRGGPLRYADSIGIGAVVDGLKGLGESRLTPCDLLENLVARDEGFYPRWRGQDD